MNISQAGIDLVKSSEGFSPTIYQDSGKPCIGYGCDLSPQEADLYEGVTISEQEAEALLMTRLSPVEQAISSLVKVPLNQKQFDALCSLAYNIGLHNFEFSTLLKELNESSYDLAGQQFSRWIYSDGQVNPGLKVRRVREAQLFNTPA